MLTMTNVQTKGRKKDLHKPLPVQRAKPKAIKTAIKTALKLSSKSKEPGACKRKLTDSVKSAPHSLPKPESELSKSAKSAQRFAEKKRN